MSRPPVGLPENLPRGERLLWQGAPEWRALALRVFHLRGLAVYFAILLAWTVWHGLRSDADIVSVFVSTLRFAGLALVPFLLVGAYAWGINRATTYTITDRRVVIRLGLALPMTINLPFNRIDNAAFRPARDGTGDIALQLAAGNKLAYLVLWPHARPWRLAKAEPMLRAIPDAERVAQLLARALAASADMAVPTSGLQAQPQPIKLGGARAAAALSA